ncbi:DUF1501 domain-containing protein [Chelatococcus sambhunathii]|uniref:DUF1501 domain-containing protein n=1 Tax=Chelatococcus sambhunathii TaxID=363953 RepID=A0ABU1DJ63_9HYPH|nr:DUF1501 domain-containing protein [Chelatococcus sambhunathii]MDR4308178.1 DUF1501 domain-containing protein [Chelatococcus sambhunathii]
MAKPDLADFARADAVLCPSRRVFLAGATSLTAALMMPRVASAAGARDPRLVVVILRGALDGLSAVPPIGDPTYESLRPDIAIKQAGPKPALPLDGMFALNPALAKVHGMVKRGEALVVHAAATGYRERSHFDGQDALENGTSAKSLDTGWLNRAMAELPTAGRAVPARGLGIGATVPLILRGPAPVVSWIPPKLDAAKEDTIDRLAALYAARDPELSRAFEAGVEIDRMANAGGAMQSATPGVKRLQAGFVSLAQGAARLMASSEGPRVAALSYDGWDTHVKEGSSDGRLAGLLGALDLALDTLRTGLGDAWKETAVIVVTEFGRTARENGADGTDHGTGTVAFLLGGAVKGGRVIADWPGLKEAQLLDGRDLAPTTDLRAVLKGVLADHLGLSAAVLRDKVFPGSENVAPHAGLIV